MNLTDKKYAAYGIVRDMMETPAVVSSFDPGVVSRFIDRENGRKLFLSGEGSSRIFPAKNAIYRALRGGYTFEVATEASTQAMEYDLRDWDVYVASNSGKTKEGVRLIRHLNAAGHGRVFSVVAFDDAPIAREAAAHYHLQCKPEAAVAATKSVIEQALFYECLIRRRAGGTLPDLPRLAAAIDESLALAIPPSIVDPIRNAGTVYWAGRNNGVAEELTLKTNEITRKRSDFLEGTYALHGVEEVMDRRDVVVAVEPFEDEEEKMHAVLEQGVGLVVIALSTRQTSFPTLHLPSAGELAEYVQLCAGWNLLLEVGLALGVNVDKPERARKVGNEFQS